MTALFDFICDERGRLLGQRWLHEHAKRHDQPARRVDLQDLTFDDHIRDLATLPRALRLEPFRSKYLVGAARAQIVLDGSGGAVSFGPLRLGNRVPDRLWRGLNVDAVSVHVSGCYSLSRCCHGSFSISSVENC